MKKNKIKSLNQLKNLADNDDGLECSIVLNGGINSRKHIYYDPLDDIFHIYNFIDDTEQNLNSRDIMKAKYTHVAAAIKQGALIY